MRKIFTKNDLEPGKIFRKLGYERLVISIGGGKVEVTVIACPSVGRRGRPPSSDVISVISFLRWLNDRNLGMVGDVCDDNGRGGLEMIFQETRKIR